MSAVDRLSAETVSRLEGAGLDPSSVATIVKHTVKEDLGGGRDVTSEATVSESARSLAVLRSRSRGRLAGLDIAIAVFEYVSGDVPVKVQRHRADGEPVQGGDDLASVEASTRALLLAERSALNLICHLSGVATATAKWVEAINGTRAVIRDTRKTTPGLRALEKYAVRCGGGSNHRMSLSDAALVKDNHVVAAGSMLAAVELVLAGAESVPVEVEVDTLEQLAVALGCGVDLVLLDNMSVDEMTNAVDLARSHSEATGRPVGLEASGGLTVERARQVAETGVDFISVGAITHSAPILDIGLDME